MTCEGIRRKQDRNAPGKKVQIDCTLYCRVIILKCERGTRGPRTILGIICGGGVTRVYIYHNVFFRMTQEHQNTTSLHPLLDTINGLVRQNIKYIDENLKISDSTIKHDYTRCKNKSYSTVVNSLPVYHIKYNPVALTTPKPNTTVLPIHSS